MIAITSRVLQDDLLLELEFIVVRSSSPSLGSIVRGICALAISARLFSTLACLGDFIISTLSISPLDDVLDEFKS